MICMQMKPLLATRSCAGHSKVLCPVIGHKLAFSVCINAIHLIPQSTLKFGELKINFKLAIF